MMDLYTNLLKSYAGRDKIMRTSSFVAVLLSGSVRSTTQRKLITFAKQISASRVVLRLFDDIPMWLVTRTWSVAVCITFICEMTSRLLICVCCILLSGL